MSSITKLYYIKNQMKLKILKLTLKLRWIDSFQKMVN